MNPYAAPLQGQLPTPAMHAKQRAWRVLLAGLAATLLPFLAGFVATVVGLVRAFSVVASASPSQKATVLARGISEAMNATVAGLVGSALGSVVLAVGVVKYARSRPALARERRTSQSP